MALSSTHIVEEHWNQCIAGPYRFIVKLIHVSIKTQFYLLSVASVGSHKKSCSRVPFLSHGRILFRINAHAVASNCFLHPAMVENSQLIVTELELRSQGSPRLRAGHYTAASPLIACNYLILLYLPGLDIYLFSVSLNFVTWLYKTLPRYRSLLCT